MRVRAALCRDILNRAVGFVDALLGEKQRWQVEYLRQIGASADSANEIRLFSLGDFPLGRFKMSEQIRTNRTLQT